MTVDIRIGDCLDVLKTLDAQSVQTCVTSPPYFGLRDYGVEGQIGLESAPDQYIAKMVAVFTEVRRVLRDDGTLWMNLGDSYATGTTSDRKTTQTGKHGYWENPAINKRIHGREFGLKPKDLIGIPWRVAFALQADGWYLRSDIIWHKPNPMPESVTDRPTKAHEYLFLLAKSERYYYDADAIKEPAVWNRENNPEWQQQRALTNVRKGAGNRNAVDGGFTAWQPEDGRNKRTVWTVATQPYSGAHFATFPPALIEPCILAGSSPKACEHCGAAWRRMVERTPMVIDRSERTHSMGHTRSSGTMLGPPRSETVGWERTCQCENEGTGRCVVLDPFGGAGTTGLVADRLGRNALLVELNPEYAKLARNRITDDNPLFADAS